MPALLRRDQFNAIAERIKDVGALHAGEIVGVDHLDSGCFQLREQGCVSTDANGRVRLSGWAEVLLHAQVKLHAFAGKPSSTARGQRRGLGNFPHTEEVGVEVARRRFFTRWHGELHVVDAVEREVGHFGLKWREWGRFANQCGTEPQCGRYGYKRFRPDQAAQSASFLAPANDPPAPMDRIASGCSAVLARSRSHRVQGNRDSQKRQPRHATVQTMPRR